ncbi:hypothetical protein AMAG_10974 [Allomyces macrogynus ATCC 38327]|uniref:RPA43 OB domain-containing protein n=1 Tax=Allomyces macrogynus (strain ATCC 38327) TaxID=578462 RepID=A0A0L0SS37_ALLM3|nr:hypothetical protein AMAG_10974 [Allomyces macrogynus ATCC 38327]|eukprot:KNE65332.1 hypothetical protein AMAG_10974 [Allomyces macrogynus ATCC 38327]
MHFHISAELLAFAPTAGARLTGVINKQSPSHIGLLVYNLFNASIPAAQLPDGAFTFQFDDTAAYAPTGENDVDDGAPRFNKGGKKAMINGNWIHAASGSVLEPGHALDFVVTEVVKSHDFISMKGTLVGVEYVPPPPTAVPTTPAAGTTSQRITFGDDDEDEEAMDVEPATTTSAETSKKSKKSAKKAEADGDDASGDADRKKRKRKLSQSAAKEEPADDAAAQQPVEAAALAPAAVEAAGKKDKKKKSKATNDGEKSSKKRKKE